MNSKNKFYKKINGNWVHRTPIKLVVNPCLRKIQFWTDKPLVLASITKWEDSNTPVFVKYVWNKVKYNKGEKKCEK